VLSSACPDRPVRVGCWTIANRLSPAVRLRRHPRNSVHDPQPASRAEFFCSVYPSKKRDHVLAFWVPPGFAARQSARQARHHTRGDLGRGRPAAGVPCSQHKADRVSPRCQHPRKAPQLCHRRRPRRRPDKIQVQPFVVRAHLRYSHLACEVLTAEVWQICEAAVQGPDLLSNFWTFLDRPPPLNPVQSAYFTKVNEQFLEKKTDEVCLPK
jgi:hypothetical protein